MMSVDGTDIAVPQFKPFWKGWYSHMLNGPGARWEVGLCIQSHHIVWIHGPFPCGHWPDLKIFHHAMISYLDDDAKAEADDGYMGEDCLWILDLFCFSRLSLIVIVDKMSTLFLQSNLFQLDIHIYITSTQPN